MPGGWRPETRLFTSLLLFYPAEHFFITTLHGPREKHHHLLSRIVVGVFTDPLSSNRRPIDARVGSRWNVFTELLPNSESIRHIILSAL
jgi:hypothetical protein